MSGPNDICMPLYGRWVSASTSIPFTHGQPSNLQSLRLLHRSGFASVPASFESAKPEFSKTLLLVASK
ncbi:hypothetical protein SOVF_056160 [Spinacia oleracea]|nr:hypothetical protein SOVF_056160 [Spinacia oleracea]